MAMFYTLTVCPSCDEVDIIPDDDCELTENAHVVSQCWQCSFEDSFLPDEDHDAHVAAHPKAVFMVTGKPSVFWDFDPTLPF